MPNGIDVEQVRSAPLPEQDYDVLFAGRLIERNNVDVLLDVLDEVADNHDVTLSLLGNGQRLEKKQETPTHVGHVEFLGHLNDYDDVLDQMRAADVFAFPSTHLASRSSRRW